MSVVGIGGYLNWIASGVLVREGNWIGLDFHVYYQAAKVAAHCPSTERNTAWRVEQPDPPAASRRDLPDSKATDP
jgi:hypothetical protein